MATSLRAELALDALEIAIWARQPRADDQLIHHSDRGVQYLAIRYSERLAEEGAVTSVGSRGDSYDNALAETAMGLDKTELIRRRGPWRTVEQVELGHLALVDGGGGADPGPIPDYSSIDQHAHRDDGLGSRPAANKSGNSCDFQCWLLAAVASGTGYTALTADIRLFKFITQTLRRTDIPIAPFRP